MRLIGNGKRKSEVDGNSGSSSERERSGADGGRRRSRRALILVSIPDRKLALMEDGKVLKVFPVAVGKASTPSPEGTFTVKTPSGKPDLLPQGHGSAPGAGESVGHALDGTERKGYGIHGTNVPKSIGKAASHGCIRMAKKDLEELFPLVKVGDTVEIRGERNEQIAQVFGGQPDDKVLAGEWRKRIRGAVDGKQVGFEIDGMWR